MKKLFLLFFLTLCLSASAQTAMQNIYGREAVSLNGKWNAMPDWSMSGEYRKVWEEKRPQGKTDFYEYSFDGTPLIDVPGDFNTQIDQMRFSEAWVWYKRNISHTMKADGNRLFLYFGGVYYKADVWLNGRHIGSHEGGYTPFQIEITGLLHEGDNALIVRADNCRKEDRIPAMGFDWFPYGGITRDVFLVETPDTYIDDYCIGFNSYVQLDGKADGEKITVEIPELKYKFSALADKNGRVEFSFKHKKLQLWSPENPKLYDVVISHGSERITDRIGFRTIEVEGNRVLLNGKEIFLKAVNMHEEAIAPTRRACNREDAERMFSYAKDLGCNLVRLAHYPHNEHAVRLAEEMGLMVWDEIPVYQAIQFDNPQVPQKIETMMGEMVKRDKNRCAVIIWSLSNETWDSSKNRTACLSAMTEKCRALDDTRIITHVCNTQGYNNKTIRLWDPLYEACDMLCLNEYLGWYNAWRDNPSEVTWQLPQDKPVFISEFGAEAKYQSNFGPKDAAGYWSEEYQSDVYRRQIEMFRATRERRQKGESNVNLAGTSPWILFDFLSLSRMHPVYQNGYNRKGLVDENGNRKQSFYLMQEFYNSLNGME